MASTGQPSAKAQLKAINEAFQQRRFDEAVERAQALLQKEPKNYQAYAHDPCPRFSLPIRRSHIFLGVSQDKSNNTEEAEHAYLNATRLRPADAQGWQGLVKLYERQGAKKLASYQSAVLALAQVYYDADELYKCQDVLDKFVDYVRAKGTRSQLIDAYGIRLPGSPIYPAMRGRFPRPDQTYEVVARLLEEEEKERVNTQIGQRRGMIGTKLSDITLEVKREVYLASRLPDVYQQLINWTDDDELRRAYEEKLLQYSIDQLRVAPAKEKPGRLRTVREVAQGMVIIKHPYRPAWDIALNWQDFQEIKEWDVVVLREYVAFFPESDLSRVLTAFLTSDCSPFPKEDQEPAAAPKPANPVARDGENDSEDEDDGGAPTSAVPLTEEDRLLIISEGVNGTDSLLAYRLAGAYYQHVEDHESNVELMKKALPYLVEQRSATGLELANTGDVLTLYLATALVFYQSPRHHAEAKALFDGVLARDPRSTPALIGVGLIYEEEEEFAEAVKFLEQALERDADNLRVRTEAAWVHALSGNYEKAKDDLANSIPLLVEKGPTAKTLLAQTQYRLGVCLWNMDTSKAWRKDRTKAYAQFLNALKNDLNCAPAYTSLGVYYADYARDKKRAKRCFQKAIELSPSEVQSAERLARSFADDGDWERVELVAQRVVDSGKVKPPPGSKRKGISWPFAALGVAQLNKGDYVKAIVSFQSATKMSGTDYHSFVGLGESYHSTGKHFSAIKAMQEAQKMEAAAGADVSGDAWFAKFLLGNINRELGLFDEAVALYRAVIDVRSDEEGVAIALMQTMVDSALASIDSGYYGKAVTLATDTLIFATKVPRSLADTFNYWKAIGDACSVFSSVQGKVTQFPTDIVRSLFGGPEQELGSDILKDVDGVDAGVIFAKGLFADDEKVGVELTRCLHATLLAHKRAIHVSSQDVHAQAVAYYNLGWAEYRADGCLPDSLRGTASRYLRAAVRCFKRAIELEAGNAEFWNALGVATSPVNPSVSQHGFVRSLYLNERNAYVWANLGNLALLQNDVVLANKAFTNAQSNDPDYAHAWLGQGFVALLLGQVKEARGLFTHAVELSEGSSLIARQQYSVSIFDHILSAPPRLTVVHLVQPLFALAQIRRLKPQDLPHGHLYAMFQERIQNFQDSVPLLEETSAKLEADYEVSESPQALKRFALAKTDLARAYLAAGAYKDAVACGETALELSSDESDNELAPDERRRARLSAHLTLGLATYYSGDLGDAVAYFEAALEESDNDPDAVCLLAQVLWAEGNDEARERARDLLFEVIEKRPDHVRSVLLLGAVALLDDDDESLEAVLSELHGLQASDKVAAGEQDEIGEVLQAIAGLSSGEGQADEKTQAQTDVMLHPHLPYGWSNLAALAEDEDGYPAQMALKVALKGIPPWGQLGAEDLAKAYAGAGTAADAQAAIVAAPWLACGWEALGDAVRE